jgi:hypothetical protein
MFIGANRYTSCLLTSLCHCSLSQSPRNSTNLIIQIPSENCTIRSRCAPNWIVNYKQELSRITGEVTPLLHLEWRVNGVRAP